MSVTLQRGYVPSRYGQLHYREALPGVAKPGVRPLILLHQCPSSSFEYEPLMRELGADRRVLAPDTPGYGMSDGPTEPLSCQAYTESFAEALPLLGLDPAHGCDVYGYHTGTLHGIELALACPEIVRSLAVSGIPMRNAEERAVRLAAVRAVPQIDETGGVVLGQASNLWKYIVAARVPGVPLGQAAANFIDKLKPLDRAQWAHHGVWDYPFHDRLPRVRQPTLLLQPHEDIPQQSLEAIRLIPRHQIVEMPEFSRDILDLAPAIARIGTELRRFFDAAAAA
jgi:pimeloyl-ACP methyl ester carboxylesterase